MTEFPYFFETNKCILDQDDFTASTGVGTVENIADYDRTTYWESIGSNDTTTETIEVQFRTPDGQEENRYIDKVLIINCNFKLFRIYTSYWNGSTYDAWVLQNTTSGNTYEHLIVSFTSVNCGKIKIEIDTTIIASEEKTMSDFIATALIYEATMPMDVYEIKNDQKAVVRRLYSGKAQKVVHYDKWAAKMEFNQITKTELDALRNIYDNYDSFIIIPELYNTAGSYDKPENFYRVIWSSSWEQKYFTKIKTAGYTLKLSLEEV